MGPDCLGLDVAHLEGRADRWVLFRHGLPHRYLPHQIPYRRQAEWLRQVGCEALLVTSSVGVLAESVPLFVPRLVGDLLMLDQRLPDGSPCTLFASPAPGQGHFGVDQGLLHGGLGAELQRAAAVRGQSLGDGVVFAYTPGPRTKTPAEIALGAAWGPRWPP